METTIPPGGPRAAALLAARAPSLRVGSRGDLVFDGAALGAIADAVGTPAWVIGADTLRARFRRLRTALRDAGLADAAIHYAVKANDHLAVLSLLGREGAGADVVSAGELRRALAAGIPPGRIVFSGVGKTVDELRLAVANGIGAVHAESREELAALSAVAAGLGRRQTVMLRINPGIEAGDHDKISTGRATDKFGIARDDAASAYAAAAALPGLHPVGLAMHVGSQIADPAPFAAAAAQLADLVRTLRRAGHAVRQVDAGGGFAIGYGVGPEEADPDAVARAIAGPLAALDVGVAIEPGRWLVGPSGVLLAGVVRRKRAVPRPFLVLDAAMNDLARPALYGAWHGIVPLRADAAPDEPCDVVGPVCESGDTLAPARLLPPLAEGDRVAILDAGAYGATMSSTYNGRPLAPVVMVADGEWQVIRPRQTVEALWEGESIPAVVANAGASG